MPQMDEDLHAERSLLLDGKQGAQAVQKDF